MSYGSTMRFTGMSGVDVEGMVQQLMKAESMRSDKVYKSKTLLMWEQERMRSIGNNVKTFQSNFLSYTSASSIVNMRSPSAYRSKTSDISSSTGGLEGSFSAKPASNASNKTSSVTVNQVAQGEQRTGDIMSSDIVGTSAVDYASISEGDYFDVTVNGKKVHFEFSQADVDALAAAGDKGAELESIVQAKFDTEFGTYNGASKVQFSIDGAGIATIKSHPEVGAEIKFSGFESPKNSMTLMGLNVDKDTGMFTGENMTIDYEINGHAFSIEMGKDAGPGVVNTPEELLNAINAELSAGGITGLTPSLVENADGVATSIKFTAEYDTDDYTIKASYVDDLGETITVKDATLAGSDKAVNFGFDKNNSGTIFNINQTMESAFGLTGNQTMTINGTEFTFDPSVQTVKDVMDTINNSLDADVTLSYSSTHKHFTLESDSEGSNASIEFGTGDDTANIMNVFGIDITQPPTQSAQDAIVVIDGIQVVRDSNQFTYDDVTYTFDAGAVGHTYESSVKSDSTDAVSNIKQFVQHYNNMVDELQKAVKETPKKSGKYDKYEPLTEEERSAMNESDIEKYEEAAKQGVVYNDPLLRRLTNEMREVLNTPVEMSDGRQVYLYEMGITTGDYIEGGKLVIDEEKLTKFAEERNDDLVEVMTTSETGLMDKLDKAITTAVGTEGYISNYAGFEGTVLVNENTLSRQIESKDEELAEIQEYLIAKENYYYRMFNAMEQSIMSSNSQMGYLMSF